jgi:hypothetical protein
MIQRKKIKKTSSVVEIVNWRKLTLLFFTFFFYTIAQAQNNSTTTTNSSLLLNQVYFKVVVAEQNFKEHFDQLDAAFQADKIKLHKKDMDSHYLLLTCSKGCVIEDIKKTLSTLNLGIIAYQEAYSNRSPEFFK